MRLYITDTEDIAQRAAQVLNVKSAAANVYCNDDVYVILIRALYEITFNKDAGRWLYVFDDGFEKITSVIEYQTIVDIKNVKDVLKNNVDQIINLCASNSRGQLNFDVMMKCVNVDSDEAERIWLRENKIDMEVLETFEDNKQYTSLADSLLCEKILDYYWYYRSKAIFDEEINTNLKELIVLKLLNERDELILQSETGDSEQKGYFRLEVDLDSYPFKWHNRDKEERLYEAIEVEEVIKHLKNKKVLITNVTRKNTKKPHPLLYNAADVYNEAQSKKVGKLQDIEEALKNLYKKGYLSNPATQSRHLPEEIYFTGKAQRILSNLKAIPEYKTYIEYVKAKKEVKITDRAFNNLLVDANHAIIPTEKPLVPEELSVTELAIYDMIVRRFLTIFMGESISKSVTVNGYIDANNFVKYEAIDNISYGWQLLYGSNSVDITSIIEAESDRKDIDNIPFVSGEYAAIKDVKAHIGTTKTKAPYTMAGVIEMMANCGKIIRSEMKKVSRRNLCIGVEEERSLIIENMRRNKLIEIIEDRVYISDRGKELLKRAPSKLCSLKFLEMFNKKIKAVQVGKEDIKQVIKQHTSYLTKYIEEKSHPEEPQNQYNYINILKNYRCPYCQNGLVDTGEYIGCMNYKRCKLKVKKEICQYTLKDKDIIQILEHGITDMITGFTFKNGKIRNGKAKLRLNEYKSVGLYFDNEYKKEE
ncbi:MAG: DNA topoisomerase [Clostridia bacterium]